MLTHIDCWDTRTKIMLMLDKAEDSALRSEWMACIVKVEVMKIWEHSIIRRLGVIGAIALGIQILNLHQIDSMDSKVQMICCKCLEHI